MISEEGGHHLQIDDPALVIDAIRKVIETTRQGQKRSEPHSQN